MLAVFMLLSASQGLAQILGERFAGREYRAVWLTTLSGLDWPSRPVSVPSDTLRQQQALRQILDRLQQAGINTVIFQTRIRATVAYPSNIEPWDGAFSGTPGRGPGYDPLAFALRECHKRGMELHAWVVLSHLQCGVGTAARGGSFAKETSRALPSLWRCLVYGPRRSSHGAIRCWHLSGNRGTL